MGDAIPTPPGQAPAPVQSTVVVPAPLTPWQALKEAGWWTRYDWAMLALILAMWVVTLFWLIFSPASSEGTPRSTTLLFVFLASISLKLFWLVSLVFRCSWFVLKAHADIAMLPQDAARIAVAYLSGKK